MPELTNLCVLADFSFLLCCACVYVFTCVNMCVYVRGFCVYRLCMFVLCGFGTVCVCVHIYIFVIVCTCVRAFVDARVSVAFWNGAVARISFLCAWLVCVCVCGFVWV